VKFLKFKDIYKLMHIPCNYENIKKTNIKAKMTLKA